MAIGIFIDTSAFCALEDESDEMHSEAIKFQQEVLLKGDYEIVVTSYILDETLTLIRSHLGIKPSIEFSKKIRASNIIKVIHVTEEVEQKALDMFEKYDDKDFSFTDCTSFVIMNDMGFKEAFTFDHHFVQMGFIERP